jgi:PhoPQ-activated pathogenicity-related protein
MSKLVIDATGDEFFQPQDDDFWWGQLPGENLRMMVDNAEHSMATGALYVLTGVQTWYKALLDGAPRPSFTWKVDSDTGAITVTTTGKQPRAVVNRVTTTLDGYRRDFRLVTGDTPANPCKYIPVPVFGKACLRPIVWVGENVGPSSVDNSTGTEVGTYVLTQDPPAVGWRAWLAELYYDSGIPGLEFQLTTQVAFRAAAGTPLYPFPLCKGVECIGDLV